MKKLICTSVGVVLAVLALLTYCYCNLIMGLGYRGIIMVVLAAAAGGTLGYTIADQ